MSEPNIYHLCPSCGDLYLIRKRDRSGYLCVMCGYLFTGRFRDLDHYNIYSEDESSLPDDMELQDIAHMVRHNQYTRILGDNVIRLNGIFSDRRFEDHPNPSEGPIPITFPPPQFEPVNEYTDEGEHIYAEVSADSILNSSGGISFMASSAFAYSISYMGSSG